MNPSRMASLKKRALTSVMTWVLHVFVFPFSVNPFFSRLHCAWASDRITDSSPDEPSPHPDFSAGTGYPSCPSLRGRWGSGNRVWNKVDLVVRHFLRPGEERKSLVLINVVGNGHLKEAGKVTTERKPIWGYFLPWVDRTFIPTQPADLRFGRGCFVSTAVRQAAACYLAPDGAGSGLRESKSQIN